MQLIGTTEFECNIVTDKEEQQHWVTADSQELLPVNQYRANYSTYPLLDGDKRHGVVPPIESCLVKKRGPALFVDVMESPRFR